MLAYIDKIKELIPIKDADRIELAKIGNWQCVVQKGLYEVGSKIVYISIDTILPDKPWAQFYKQKSNRVRTSRFKKVWSQGIIESLKNLELDNSLEVGTDVTELLGIIKYEPAVTQHLDAKGHLPFGIFRTDEENVNNLDEIPFGEKVIVTEKCDGSSFSAYCKFIDREWITGVTSRGLELKLECENSWTIITKKLGILDKLKEYCQENNQSLCIRGELTGNGLNSSKPNWRSQLPLEVHFFNILDLSTLKYIPFETSEFIFAAALFLKTVPVLERKAVLTPELIEKYKNLDYLNGKYFEGVVIKLEDGNSFKILNLLYDSLK